MEKFGIYKILRKFLILAIIVAMAPSINLSAEVDGYGKNGKFLAPIETPDPSAIKIYTAEDLDDVRNNLGGSYVLMNDINLADLAEDQWEPIGDLSKPFTGIFDGQGYAIKNLTITDTAYHYVGLFGYTNNGSTIKNARLESAHIDVSYSSGPSYAGGICGYNNGSIFNCYNAGDISTSAFTTLTGAYVGGICGYNKYGLISKCYSIGYISASASSYGGNYPIAGGICSYNESGSIVSCYNTGDISTTSSSFHAGNSQAGGICAYNDLGSISNCYSTGDISVSTSASHSQAGGICGNNYFGSIISCYTTGNISSYSADSSPSAGGICGISNGYLPNNVSNCVVLSSCIYAENSSNPSDVHCYLISNSGTKTNNLACNTIEGDPTNDATRLIDQSEAKDQATYEELGWDFDNIWYMVLGCDYPQLRGKPLESGGKYTVTFAAGDYGTMDSESVIEKVEPGKTVTVVPEITVNEGYVFIGWYSNHGGTYDAEAVSLYPITRDITFTAVYSDSANATVIFDYKGGKAKEIEPDREVDPDKEAVSDREVESDYVSGRPGDTYDMPIPRRTGYLLIGWLHAESGSWLPDLNTGTFGAAGSINKYIAQWAAIINTVTFETGENGAINPAKQSENVYYSQTVKTVPEVMAKDGYFFLGWESNFGGIYDSEAIKSYPIIRDITFTARYASLSKATVIFDYDGGAVGSDTIKYFIGEPGERYDKPAPIKTGFTLDGWSPEEPGGIFGDRGSSIVYTAKWKANIYTVTFQAGINGMIDSDTESKEVSYRVEFEGNVEEVPLITADSGYTFLDSWSTNGGSPYYSSKDILGLAITGDTVFTARYQSLSPPGGGGGSRSDTATLTVRGVDKTSNSTIYNQSTTVLVGETEIVPAPIIKGYALDKDSPTSQSITIKTGSNTVAFSYLQTTEEPGVVTGGEGSGSGGRPGQQIRMPASTKVKEALETEKHIRYINGYPGGTVRPDGNISRAEVALIFWRLLKDPVKNESISGRFSDIKGDEIYAQAVNYLAKIGILQGYKDGSFRPWAAISRVEFVAVTGRFDDLASGRDNPFKDVPEDYWAYGYILSAYQKGWIEGYPGGEFRPRSSISRAEAVKIVNCLLGRGIQLADLPADLPNYPDLARSHWAYCEIMEASCDHEYERKEDGWERWREEQVIGNK